MSLDHLWVPPEYRDKPLRKTQIFPMPNQLEFGWICADCRNQNTMEKQELSDNRSYSCFNCGWTWTVGIIPDDIRDFLTSTNPPSERYQPRIVVR